MLSLIPSKFHTNVLHKKTRMTVLPVDGKCNSKLHTIYHTIKKDSEENETAALLQKSTFIRREYATIWYDDTSWLQADADICCFTSL